MCELHAALLEQCDRCLVSFSHLDPAGLRLAIRLPDGELEPGRFHPGSLERELEGISLAGLEACGKPRERQLAGTFVQRIAEVAGGAAILAEAAGHARGRPVAEMQCKQRGRGEERNRECGERARKRSHGAARRVSTRPSWLASVPNHIAPVFSSYIMWRMVSLTSSTATNLSRFGSKATSFLSGPVCETHSRPSLSFVRA